MNKRIDGMGFEVRMHSDVVTHWPIARKFVGQEFSQGETNQREGVSGKANKVDKHAGIVQFPSLTDGVSEHIDLTQFGVLPQATGR